MNPLDGLNSAVNELIDSFMAHDVVGDETATLTSVGLTQYIFWMTVALVLLLVVVFVFRKKQSQSLVPHGVFVNGMEYIIEFARDDLCKSILPETWKKHFPFIFALFFFILANNIVGIIPGCHPGTGTMGVTAALALYSFVYFIVVGCKNKGVWGYIKSLAPEGVAFPLNVLVWLIELFSTFLRLVTLAVRLFCNMFAGHVVMGAFAILASLFVEPLTPGHPSCGLPFSSSSTWWRFWLPPSRRTSSRSSPPCTSRRPRAGSRTWHQAKELPSLLVTL